MSLVESIQRGLWRISQKTPFYSLAMMKKNPAALSYVMTDLWPGDAKKGRRLREGSMIIGDEIILLKDLWDPLIVHEDNQHDLHVFSWLRDLRTIGDNASRRLARQLIVTWIEAYSDWRSPFWAAGFLGHRLCNWIALYEFFCASADEDFRGIFFKSLFRQAIHLKHSWYNASSPLDRFYALKGLIFSCICLWDDKEAVTTYLTFAEKELAQQLYTDGTHISRDASVQLTVLQDLIDIRTLLRASSIPVPSFILGCISRMTPVLRLFRHGDGSLATFGGKNAHAATLVDVVLSLSDAKGRPPQRLLEAGFERCATKSGVLITKIGDVHRAGTAEEGLGLFQFEWSIGKEKMITNGDIVLEHHQNIDWMNLIKNVDRHTQKGHTLLNMMANSGGYVHSRQIHVTDDTASLRGEDQITLPIEMAFAIRFQLGAQIETAKVTPDGHGVHLKTTSGQAWRLLVSGSEPIVCQEEKNSLSICLLSHATPHENQVLKWVFLREDA